MKFTQLLRGMDIPGAFIAPILFIGKAVGYTGQIRSLEKQMENDGEVWRDIASKYNLKESRLSKLASAWHTDLDLGRQVEIMTDMSKSRKLGFNIYKPTIDSFIELFEELRLDKLIP